MPHERSDPHDVEEKTQKDIHKEKESGHDISDPEFHINCVVVKNSGLQRLRPYIVQILSAGIDLHIGELIDGRQLDPHPYGVSSFKHLPRLITEFPVKERNSEPDEIVDRPPERSDPRNNEKPCERSPEKLFIRSFQGLSHETLIPHCQDHNGENSRKDRARGIGSAHPQPEKNCSPRYVPELLRSVPSDRIIEREGTEHKAHGLRRKGCSHNVKCREKCHEQYGRDQLPPDKTALPQDTDFRQ